MKNSNLIRKIAVLALLLALRPNCAGFDSLSSLKADSKTRFSARAAAPIKLDIRPLNVPSLSNETAGIEPLAMGLSRIAVPANPDIALGPNELSDLSLAEAKNTAPIIRPPASAVRSGRGFHWRLNRTLISIQTAVRRLSFGSLYDCGKKEGTEGSPVIFGSGIIHGRLKPLKLRHGVEKVADSLHLPNANGRQYFHSHARSDETPVILKADPRSPAAIERAIRDLFDSQPAAFGLSDGNKKVLTNDDLALVHITPVEGTSGRAHTVHAVFRQIQKGAREDGRPYYLPVHGASISLTLKVLNGQMVLKGYDGHLYPIQVDMTPRLSNDILQLAAAQRLLPVTKSGRIVEKLKSFILKPLNMTAKERQPVFLNREIIPDDKGRWHAANIYQDMDLYGQPVNIGVDISTGETFAWNAHGISLRPRPVPSENPAQPASFKAKLAANGPSLRTAVAVKGRGNTPDHGNDHGPIDAMPMPRLKIRDSDGRLLGVTDDDGRLVFSNGETIEVTADLEGEYATVADANRNNQPLRISIKLVPGELHRATINPTSDNDELIGQINSYLGWTHLVKWMKSIGINDRRVDRPLSIYNNKTDAPCNAYYDPLSDTLNLQRASEDCENTAQPSILLHESGHRFVQLFARTHEGYLQSLESGLGLPRDAFQFLRQSLDFIMGGGVNEGTADTISMYFRDNPKIGEHFFKHPGSGLPLVIRDGRNVRSYQPGEVHDEGETLMGATWEIYEEIKRALGEEAGAAYASSLVIPALILSQPKDVPSALAQILLAALHEDGKSPFADIILRAAERRGIRIPGFAKPWHDPLDKLEARAA